MCAKRYGLILEEGNSRTPSFIRIAERVVDHTGGQAASGTHSETLC